MRSISLEELWRTYRSTSIPRGLTEEEMERLYAAFKWGALSLARLLDDAVKDGDPIGALAAMEALASAVESGRPRRERH